MAKLPSFQFYPGDWMKDPDLKRCSHFAKGLLMDLLCLMHENATRGKLCEPDGVTPWTTDDLCRAVGAFDNERAAVVSGLEALEAKNVLSRDHNGVLYSRRMVRDEDLRAIRADSGRQGGLAKRKQNASKPPSKTEAKASPSSSSSSSSSSSTSVKEEKDPPADAAVSTRKPKPKFDPLTLCPEDDPIGGPWSEWVEHRRQKGKSTESSWRKSLAKLKAIPADEARAMVDHSIAGNFQGLYPPGGSNGSAKPVRISRGI